MTSISSALNSYFNFFNNQSGSGSTAVTTPAVSTNTLTDALNALSGSGSQDAYALNLSSTAQNYLSGASSATSDTQFQLTSDQQKTINSILAKYKDAPYTQETLNEIKADLKAAGVSADQLSLMDKSKSFNPTATLISALNGDDTDPLTAQQNSSATQQTKSDNYLKTIISAWQKISTTYGADSAS